MSIFLYFQFYDNRYLPYLDRSSVTSVHASYIFDTATADITVAVIVAATATAAADDVDIYH